MQNWPWPTKKTDCNKLHMESYGLTYGPIKLTRMQAFFSYYIRQQMILADVTVGCQSNSRRVSSISDFLATAAKSSAGGTACSRLPCRPHRPLLLPPLARASLYSSTPPVILRRQQPHTAAEPVNPRTPLRVGIHCRVFPDSVLSPS